MKILKIFLAIMATSVGIANAQFTKAELQVSGLTCSMCSKATEKSLRKLDFIADIKPDLNRNIFNITFKKDVPVNFEMLNANVQRAGFTVNTLKAVFNFNNTEMRKDVFHYSGYSFHLINGGSKQLNGPVAITFVDKGFASSAVAKKYTGQKPVIADSKRVYCVTI
ncbi:MAG: copper chaperone [Sphingobacteriaceae bacterium]|nr:MAG: copper chaperone [Sphingobacteriaceae bacterium]